MTISSLVAASLLTLTACASSAVVLGSTQAGPYTFDVSYEGPVPTEAGAKTRMILKATAGGMPTSIVSWIGPAEVPAAEKVAATFDPADSDYDTDLTVPSPLPAGAKYYFDVNTNGTIVTGSKDL